jgi:hypothetical protein
MFKRNAQLNLETIHKVLLRRLCRVLLTADTVESAYLDCAANYMTLVAAKSRQLTKEAVRADCLLPPLLQMQRLQERAGLAPQHAGESAFQATPSDVVEAEGDEDEDERILQEVLRLSRMEFEGDVVATSTIEVHPASRIVPISCRRKISPHCCCSQSQPHPTVHASKLAYLRSRKSGNDRACSEKVRSARHRRRTRS